MRILAGLLVLLTACSSGGGEEESVFSDLEVVTLISGPARFRVWIADSNASRARGLMDATADDLEPLADGTARGMLFVFPVSQSVSFWMKDTEVPLDLAYLDESGRILEVHALLPLDLTPVPSAVPIRYALEVRAGELGIGVGDVVDLP